MFVNISEKRIKENNAIFSFINDLKRNEDELSLRDAYVYYDFPVFKDLDEDVLVAQILLVSPIHGIILFHLSEANTLPIIDKELENIIGNLENLYTILYTRLLRNRELRSNKTSLKYGISTIIFCPHFQDSVLEIDTEEIEVITSVGALKRHLDTLVVPAHSTETFKELIATLEGAKGLLISKVRESKSENSKAEHINELEREILGFDQYQKTAYMQEITGVSRVRGLAGSGKTVVLAIKAALTHLRNPDARIAYTFYTKSLYQHIKRLITRFYRQFDDRDPNWDNLEIIHAWGSVHMPGIYYNASIENSLSPMGYTEALRQSRNAFDYVCKTLVKRGELKKSYDFIFIDEGQDFPSSFLELCVMITNDSKIIWAYDELQTIFQTSAPTTEDIFGVDEKGAPKVELEEDIILYKCYRNPREVLVVAHALGFGIYGNRIVQMIESEDYWKDIGYIVSDGTLSPNSKVKILRPPENSLESISKKYSIDQLVTSFAAANIDLEVEEVCKRIKSDITQGLLAEDILVITVDDRYAASYLGKVQEILAETYSIASNNMHSDKFAVKDFQIKDRVTLSTVYKAKGNEAYSVYIVGVDALFKFDPTIKERNVLFTAITRTKGWVCLSGIGGTAQLCFDELMIAKQKFPYLEFDYPDDDQIKYMKRDIQEGAVRKSKAERILEDLLSDLSPEEINRFLEQRSKKKGI